MNRYTKRSGTTLREQLKFESFQFTQHEATERPLQNEFLDHKEPGIYVDIVPGEPLFSSLDTFDAQCGWPSFSQPLEEIEIIE